MTSIAPHITAFLKQRLAVERGVSENTSDSYAYTFSLLFAYSSEHLKVRPSELLFEQMDAPLVASFLEHLEKVRGNKPNSRNVRLSAIKSFMRYMEYRVPSALDQIRQILAIPAKRGDTRLVRHLAGVY